MSRIIDWLQGRDLTPDAEERSIKPLDFDDWVQSFGFNGLQYPFLPSQMFPGEPTKEIGGDFRGLVEGAYKSNGPVFSLMLVRLMLFSEARFKFRQLREGRPGNLFGTAELAALEEPWPGATTGDLLTRMIQDADLAGNFYGYRNPNGGITRLRPDWMTIVMGSTDDPEHPGGQLDMELIGYAYQPGGRGASNPVKALLPQQIAHFAPIPDPGAYYRGMSWLTPVIREIMGDDAATNHKLKFFENGASLNTVVSLDPSIEKEKFEKWVEAFDKKLAEPYKTLYLGGGADLTTVGTNLRQVDFKAVQGAGETRLAAAAGVPPVIAGFSEGLAAATYSNYGQARRRFADGTLRPLWRNAAGSMASIVNVPGGSELWFDDRDISFLQDDMKDRAEIQATQAQAAKALIEAGYEPDSVVDAIGSDDFSRLVHSGLVSVQLQPPGSPPPSANGSGQLPSGAAVP